MFTTVLTEPPVQPGVYFTNLVLMWHYHLFVYWLHTTPQYRRSKFEDLPMVEEVFECSSGGPQISCTLGCNGQSPPAYETREKHPAENMHNSIYMLLIWG